MDKHSYVNVCLPFVNGYPGLKMGVHFPTSFRLDLDILSQTEPSASKLRLSAFESSHLVGRNLDNGQSLVIWNL